MNIKEKLRGTQKQTPQKNIRMKEARNLNECTKKN